MSDETMPLTRDLRDNLSRLLSILTTNLGGDAKQLEQNFSADLVAGDLQDALEPLMVCQLLCLAIVVAENGQQKTLPLFRYSLLYQKSEDGQGGHVVDAVKITFLLQAPPLQEELSLVQLLVSENDLTVAVFDCIVSTDEDQCYKDANTVLRLLQDLGSNINQGLREIVELLFVCSATAISKEDLPPKGKECQKILVASITAAAEAEDAKNGASNGRQAPDVHKLPLNEQMRTRIPEALAFLEGVYSLPENALFDLYEPALRDAVANDTALTLAALRESALSHEALSDMVSHTAANLDEANLLAFEIPLRDDNGKTLDSLIVTFSSDNVTLELKSGNMAIAATPLPDNAYPEKFRGAKVAGLVKGAGAQATANKALLTNALRQLNSKASGTASKAIRQALLTLSNV